MQASWLSLANGREIIHFRQLGGLEDLHVTMILIIAYGRDECRDREMATATVKIMVMVMVMDR